MPNTPGPETKLTPDLAQRICLLLMEGVSLRRICQMEGMPAKGTVMVWLAKDDAEGGPYATFQDQYARARRVQAETLVDEIIDIADNRTVEDVAAESDTISTEKGDFPNKEWMQRSALRIDARKWYASKVLPKKYGEKLALTDGDGKPLPVPEIRVYTGAPPLANSEKDVDDDV
ncbi:hypothetical protein K3G63_11010 [Hymenobacter sp. HSC-4F20]|uniref:terminase small subunit-like protein n=1 Tax=Hymenobacter sp. HSC-4F20 TaxID=2864135 RepID=UPI001C73AE9A|nr:hypothetical protein [Hymenobacter sp. HSC-4F20]MBX0290972.1 hypothetical protein [Hymenobacter sp. HSC-4F20]